MQDVKSDGASKCVGNGVAERSHSESSRVNTLARYVYKSVKLNKPDKGELVLCRKFNFSANLIHHATAGHFHFGHRSVHTYILNSSNDVKDSGSWRHFHKTVYSGYYCLALQTQFEDKKCLIRVTILSELFVTCLFYTRQV